MNTQKILFVMILMFSVVLSLSLFMSPQFSNAANTNGSNYKNVTVWTHVNITNSRPLVLSVFIYEDTNTSIRNITLNAGSLRRVTCNATVRDWDGHNDIVGVNATIWHQYTSQTGYVDDNNSHYTNLSCTKGSTLDLYDAQYTCNFNVLYYANNGTWGCNVTAIDNAAKNGSLFNTTTFNPYYALNVTDGIDYGNMQVDDISLSSILANITNFGNMPLNISVEGYGVRRGDGLAMNCSLSGNITVDNAHFSLTDVAWGSMTALSSTRQLISGLTISKQTNDTQMINTTYWRLYIPPNPAGNCTGYVLFSAEAP